MRSRSAPSVPPQPRVLHDILGIGERAGQPVRDGQQVRAQLLELVDSRARSHDLQRTSDAIRAAATFRSGEDSASAARSSVKYSYPVRDHRNRILRDMAIAEPPALRNSGKGLQAGALGLVGNVVIGLSAVAPAYSLAATLGYVVLAVGDKAPSMFLLAFIPMLLVAFAYKELSQDTPDCGTTFTWGTKAFGPWIGWIGGWGLAVSAIIVLANVAEVAAIYLFKFLGQDELAENLAAKVALGSFFIVAHDARQRARHRGVRTDPERPDRHPVRRVDRRQHHRAGPGVRRHRRRPGDQPALSWLWPGGLDYLSIAAAVILCIFIYWGWDACLAVGEETKDPGKTPGIAAVITTLILVCTYVLVAYAMQSFAGFGDVGIGLNNPNNTDDVLTVLGEPVAGRSRPRCCC